MIPEWLIDDYNEAAFTQDYIYAHLNYSEVSTEDVFEAYMDLLHNVDDVKKRLFNKHRLFIKLYQDTFELKKMWESIRRNYAKHNWLMDFYDDVIYSLDFPNHQRVTDKKTKNNIENIEKLANKLSKSLLDSGLDIPVYKLMDKRILMEIATDRRTGESKNNLELSKMIFDCEPNRYMSDFILELPKEIKCMIGNRLFMATNSDKAEQTYFIRSLTSKMRERFNSPMRSICAASALTIFDNDKITEAYIASIAP